MTWQFTYRNMRILLQISNRTEHKLSRKLEGFRHSMFIDIFHSLTSFWIYILRNINTCSTYHHNRNIFWPYVLKLKMETLREVQVPSIGKRRGLCMITKRLVFAQPEASDNCVWRRTHSWHGETHWQIISRMHYRGLIHVFICGLFKDIVSSSYYIYCSSEWDS